MRLSVFLVCLAVVLSGGCRARVEKWSGRGVAISWGATGITYRSENDNQTLFRNFLAHLGEGREKDTELRILYTANCDPRVEADLCHLASDYEALRPFFEMVESLGMIEFGVLSSEAFNDYSVVIADFCHGLDDDTRRSLLKDYLLAGGRVLVLADNYCVPDGVNTSAAVANTVFQPLGLSFTDLDPPIDVPLSVPPSQQMGLLEGVESVFIWRVSPQVVAPPFSTVLDSELGALATIASFEL